ncbi:CAD15 protein, partial [Crypturellus undulatus]|nr:CAD15 protein [Crypturellus undulatus]
WRHMEAPRRVKRAWVIPPISVSENHKRIPHLLVQIKSDKQQPGGVIYSIKGPGVDEEPAGIFSIDKLSGKVFLNATLDREQNDRYRLKAFALDLDGRTLEEPTDLEIIVVDQNDNRPLFRQDVFTARVLEGAEPGTCVLRAEATDADDAETDNAVLRYSILEQGPGGLFAINGSTGEICTARPGLDRETVAVHNLTLQVADMSGDGLATTATAVIYVEDINDNPPEFTKEEWSLEVPEQAAGVDVGRLLVHDKDLAGSANWRAKFTILEGDPEGAFAIRTDPHTNDGVLSVAKVRRARGVPHGEKVSPMGRLLTPLPLSAAAGPRDAGALRADGVGAERAGTGGGRAGQRAGARRILPRVSPMPGPAVRVSLTAAPCAHSYALLYDPAGWLQLDPHAGTVRTQRPRRPPAAFLQGGWYIALVLAHDDARPPLSATGTLSIEIVEVNDHAPLLQPPAGPLCARPGPSARLLLGATDDDRPPHAAPFHFQLGPQLARNWSVARYNVTHAVLAPLVELPPGLYSLPLLLRDSGTPPRERQQLLNVSVCPCGPGGACLDGARTASRAGAGVALGALLAVLGSLVLLLLLALLGAARERGCRRALRRGLLRRSRDDVRDNVLNYDEQGGGEEDQGLRAADADPGVPPYDTALIYDYEGSGSVGSALSSLVSSLADEDQDYDYLREWGPRFCRLADLYG